MIPSLASFEIPMASGPPVRVRPLDTRDAEAWSAYAIENLGTMPYVGTLPDEVATADVMRTKIASWDADRGDLVCGFFDDVGLAGDIGLYAGNRRKTAHVVTLAMSMAPRLQGLGIGTASFGPVIEWARKHPLIEKIELGVLAPNTPAIRLYERFGFEREGVRRGHIRQLDGTLVDEILMARWVTD